MPLSTARALIVEDDQEFQIALTDALDQVPGNWRAHIYSLGQDAVSFLAAPNAHLDLALIDLGLPDMDGTKIIGEVRAAFPDVPILVISVLTCHNKIREAMFAGATGYILKDDDIFDVATSINLVLNGHSPISAAMARGLIELLPRPPTSPAQTDFSLTRREVTLLACIAEGMSYPEAAKVMNLKIGTIHSYSRGLFRKLGVNSQRQAITLARKNGLISA